MKRWIAVFYITCSVANISNISTVTGTFGTADEALDQSTQDAINHEEEPYPIDPSYLAALSPELANKVWVSSHLRIQKYSDEFTSSLFANAPHEIRTIYHILNHADQCDPIDLPKQILLVGPPGTGKSSIAQMLAQKLHRLCYFFSCSNLANEYQNSGATRIASISEHIRHLNAPCIIILDEMHEVMKYASEKNKIQENPHMATQLWSMFDEHKDNPNVIFIGTTNTKEVPDQFKSRFSEIITIPLPNQSQRVAAIDYLIKKRRHAYFDVDAHWIAKRTNNFSYRDIESVIRKSAIHARAHKINPHDISIVTHADVTYAINHERTRQKNHADKESSMWTMTKTAAPYAFQVALTAAGLYLTYYLTKKQFAFNDLQQNIQMQESKRLMQIQLDENKKLHDENLSLQQNQIGQQSNWNFVQAVFSFIGMCASLFS